MSIIKEVCQYRSGDVLMEALVVYDARLSGVLPVVMIHHAWGGRDQFVADKAQKLAELGYLAFAADVYGNGRVGSCREENAALMQPLMQNRGLLRQRLTAAFDAARNLPRADAQRIATMGFCFGGLCALDLARSGVDLRAAISFHGLLLPPTGVELKSINAKVLVLHGHDDPMVQPEQVLALQNELTAAGVDWQVHVYGRTLHAFTNPQANDADFGTVYQADADRRSWQSMQNFLQEVLR
jgi:dienelactone hydrolase